MSGRSGPDGSLAVTSETLGLELRLEDDRLRLWDPEVQEYLLDRNEERARSEAERDARLAAEQRVRDLESQLADSKVSRPEKH